MLINANDANMKENWVNELLCIQLGSCSSRFTVQGHVWDEARCVRCWIALGSACLSSR